MSVAVRPSERDEIGFARTRGQRASPSPTPAPGGAEPSDFDWRRRYSRGVLITDLLTLVWVVFGTQIAVFGFQLVGVSSPGLSGDATVSYWIFSTALVLAWLWALSLADTRSERVIGTGTAEYTRIVEASIQLFGLIAIAAFLLRIDIARGFLLLSLPIGVLMLISQRWLWRQWLVSQRSVGRYTARVLLVGSAQSVAQIARELRRSPAGGYLVVGACVPGGLPGRTVEGTDIQIVGGVDAIEGAVALTGADTVAVTSTDELPPDRVKQISWMLESGKQQLVLAPSIVDIAGPRIHTRPVSGLPLIHVETPRFTKGQAFVKRTFDLVVSVLLVAMLSPFLLALAAVVKVTSRGPVLFRQMRIGLGGAPFGMLKFRSMREGADAELADLLRAQGTEKQPLFKVKDDPRITRIGRVLRKYSLDEFPQLFNVIAGSMSLVGPRPQVAAEVALYSDAARRRLLARPGITGLWQVSGRSTLDWEDTVRLDLYYVENWTLAGDVAILAKTVRAMLLPGDTAH